MRALARWVGELLLGRALPLRLVLLRCALMFGASGLLGWGAVEVALADADAGAAPGGHPLWHGLVLLAVVLAIRASYELWELDAALSLASVVALAFAAIALAASQNVARDPSLTTRVWVLAAIAAGAGALAVWRGVVAARSG